MENKNTVKSTVMILTIVSIISVGNFCYPADSAVPEYSSLDPNHEQFLWVMALEKGDAEDQFWNPTLYKISVQAGKVIDEIKVADQGAPFYCRKENGRISAVVLEGVAANGTYVGEKQSITYIVDINEMKVLDRKVSGGNVDEIELYREKVLLDKSRRLEINKPNGLQLKDGQLLLGRYKSSKRIFKLNANMTDKEMLSLEIVEPNIPVKERTISLYSEECATGAFFGSELGNSILIGERYIVLLFYGESALGKYAPGYVIIADMLENKVKQVAIGSNPANGIIYSN